MPQSGVLITLIVFKLCWTSASHERDQVQEESIWITDKTWVVWTSYITNGDIRFGEKVLNAGNYSMLIQLKQQCHKKMKGTL